VYNNYSTTLTEAQQCTSTAGKHCNTSPWILSASCNYWILVEKNDTASLDRS